MKQKQKKVAVIGRGIVGLATGFRLMQSGFSVFLFGSRNHPNMGTLASLGVSSVKGAVDPKKPDFRLKCEGVLSFLEWLKQVEKFSEKKIPFRRGVWEHYENEVERTRILSRLQIIEEGTIKNRDIEEKENAAFFGLKTSHEKRSFFYPKDCWVDTKALCDGLDNALIRSNCVKIVDSLVINIQVGRNNKFELETKQNQVVKEIDEVVVACGAFANKFFDPLISVRKKPLIVGGFKKTEFKNRSRDTLREPALNVEIKGTKPVVHFQNCSEQVVLKDQESSLASTLKGLRSKSPDFRPWIGPLLANFSKRSFLKNVYFNIGHYKSAVCTADPSAKILLKYLQESEIEKWELAFSPTRFQ